MHHEVEQRSRACSGYTLWGRVKGKSGDGVRMAALWCSCLCSISLLVSSSWISFPWTSVGSSGGVGKGGMLCWFQVSLLSQWWTGLGQWGKSRIGLKEGLLKRSPLGCLGLYSVFNNSWIRWWDGCGCSCLLATSELAISKLGIRLGLAEPFIRHGWFMVVLS